MGGRYRRGSLNYWHSSSPSTDRPPHSVLEGAVTMELVVAALMVIVAVVFVGITMHAARDQKGRG